MLQLSGPLQVSLIRTPWVSFLRVKIFSVVWSWYFPLSVVPLILESWMTRLGNVNHFLSSLFISVAVFAFSFIEDALIVGRGYDDISFNVL